MRETTDEPWKILRGMLQVCVPQIDINTKADIVKVPNESLECFVTLPLDFQYQNEKRVTTDRSYFFKKFCFSKSSSLAEHVFSFYF